MATHQHPAPARAHGVLSSLETKNEDGATSTQEAPGADAIREFMGAWEEFKSTNDERLAQIEKKGEDFVTADKLSKIEKSLLALESDNQSLTLAQKNAESLAELETKFDEIATVINRTAPGAAEAKDTLVNDWCRAVYRAYDLGVPNLGEDEKKALEAVAAEAKALNIGTSTEGGYLAPSEMVREIIKGETEISAFRSLVRVRQTANRSVELPKRTGQFAAVRVGEQGTRSETTGLAYGVEEITLHELYALVDVTHAMLEDSAFNMQSEISMEASEQFAVKEGAEFVSGTGVGMAEGFLQHSNAATTNSGAATAITADGMLTAKFAIKTAYAQNATWLMNRTTMGSVRKLKDSNGVYIWQPGIAQGKPNMIDGDPYVEIPDMPSEGAGNKPVAYGDWRRAYTWVDRIAMDMLRDPYTQDTSGKIRFRWRKRSSGKVTLAEAYRVLVCAA